MTDGILEKRFGHSAEVVAMVPASEVGFDLGDNLRTLVEQLGQWREIWPDFCEWLDNRKALLAANGVLKQENDDLCESNMKLRYAITDAEDELAQVKQQHELERARLERTRQKNADLEVRNATGKKVW